MLVVTVLHLPIECGSESCASERGKFCRFLAPSVCVGHSFCSLFGKRLQEPDGWLLRLPECLEAQTEEPRRKAGAP